MKMRLSSSFYSSTRILLILACLIFLSSCEKLWHPQLDILKEAQGDWVCKNQTADTNKPNSKFGHVNVLRIYSGLQQTIQPYTEDGFDVVVYSKANRYPPTEKNGWLYSKVKFEGMTMSQIDPQNLPQPEAKYSLKMQNKMLLFTFGNGMEVSCKRFSVHRYEIDELENAIKSASLKTQKNQSLKNNISFMMCASVKPTGYCAGFKAHVCNDSNRHGQYGDAVASALIPTLERNGCIDGGFYPPDSLYEATANESYAVWMKEAYNNDSVRNSPSGRSSNIANSSLPVTSISTSSVLNRTSTQQEATDAAVPSQISQTQPTATETPASNKSQNSLSTYTGKFSYSTEPNALDEGEVCFYPNKDSSNLDPRKDTSHDFWFCLRNTDTAKAILRIPSGQDPTICSYEGNGSVTVFDYYEAVNVESDEFDYATLRMASADAPVAKKCE